MLFCFLEMFPGAIAAVDALMFRMKSRKNKINCRKSSARFGKFRCRLLLFLPSSNDSFQSDMADLIDAVSSATVRQILIDSTTSTPPTMATALLHVVDSLPVPPVILKTTPLEDVFVAVSSCWRLVLYLLSWVYTGTLALISFVTLTTPRLVYSILSWGVVFSLRLDVTKVAALLLVGGTILSYVYKVRFLNRYTTLKEIPLEKDEGFDL